MHCWFRHCRCSWSTFHICNPMRPSLTSNPRLSGQSYCLRSDKKRQHVTYHNVSSTCYTALLANDWFISLEFLLVLSCILFETVIIHIHIHLPQCNLQFWCHLLQFNEFVFIKMGKIILNDMQKPSCYCCNQKLQCESFFDIIMPNYEG